jgi:hypothetical protein
MPRTPQPPSLESKTLRFGNKDPIVVARSVKMSTWYITDVMVQMMKIGSGIRKPLFSGQLTLKND